MVINVNKPDKMIAYSFFLCKYPIPHHSGDIPQVKDPSPSKIPLSGGGRGFPETNKSLLTGFDRGLRL